MSQRRGEPRTINANSASMHPRLAAHPASYYEECGRLGGAVKDLLKQQFGCEHSLYLTSNTTTGFVSLLLFVLANDLVPLALGGGTYPFYRRWLEQCFAGRVTEPGSPHRSILLTHVCNVCGRTYPLGVGPADIRLVDAAQSLGTFLQAELFASAPVFFAPAHKHLGLAAGVGVVGINFNALRRGVADSLASYAPAIEHGTVNISQLEECLRALKGGGAGADLNAARIHVGTALQTVAERLGLEIITPRGVQAHIVTLRSKLRPIPEFIDVFKCGGKYIKDLNALRLSFHSQQFPDCDPHALEEMAAKLLWDARVRA